MPGLNCNFRIEDVQECDNLLDPFEESDDGESDWPNDDDEITLEDSEYSNNRMFYNDSLTSGESGSSDEESSDDQSEEPDKLSNTPRNNDFNINAISHELCKMDSEQCELAQNLIAAILHEGVMGRLTQNTVLKQLTPEENNVVPAAPESC